MAKGNILLGYATGSIGDITLSRVKGNQVTKARNRHPSNPKTSKQVYQRAKFTNAVNFYKRGVQNLFKFAYEDKTAQESDFNAFMRHNTARAIPVGKVSSTDSFYPAISNWLTSVGSLNGPQAVIGQVGNLNTGISAAVGRVHAVGSYNVSPSNAEGAATPLTDNADAAVYSGLLNTTGDDIDTYGGMCAALKATYPDLQEGDIVTVTLIHQILQGIDQPFGFYPSTVGGDGAGTAPRWYFAQFVIDSTSTTAIASAVNEGKIFLSDGLAFSSSLMSGDSVIGFYLSKTWQQFYNEIIGGTFDPDVFTQMSSCVAACMTFSRETSSGLKVSTQEFSTSEGYQKIIELSQTEAFTQLVLNSWGATDAAILEGSFVKA